MAIFNYKKREISAKIVYYGPALCGKTTNVQFIHQKLNPRQRGDLVSLATDADRTLFFDFLPIELENVGGFKTRFQIYTVPGQVYYNSTRKAVLTGVDGVVFVADSQSSMREENLESLNNLIDNLKYYNRDISKIPLVLQYNKRDLDDILTMDELNDLFKDFNAPRFPAAAVTGQGVLETLTACCKLVLQDLKRKSVRPQTQASSMTAPTTSQEQTQAQKSGPTLPETTKSSMTLTNSPPEAVSTEALAPPSGGPTGKPEIVQIGKPRQVDPYTITLPLRLSTSQNKEQLLSVELTLSITGLLQDRT
jgi:signal recognition particle receptor subunit beta